jgi:hypothetical protein
MKLILTYCIRFIVALGSLRFADYKPKLAQVTCTINRIQYIKISFLPCFPWMEFDVIN